MTIFFSIHSEENSTLKNTNSFCYSKPFYPHTYIETTLNFEMYLSKNFARKCYQTSAVSPTQPSLLHGRSLETATILQNDKRDCSS